MSAEDLYQALKTALAVYGLSFADKDAISVSMDVANRHIVFSYGPHQYRVLLPETQ